MIIVGLVYRFDRQDTQRYEYVYKGNLEQWLEQLFTPTNPIFSTNFKTLYVPHLHLMQFRN
jgi:hypothetical protein